MKKYLETSKILITLLLFSIGIQSCSDEDFMLAEPVVSDEINKSLPTKINGEKIFTSVEQSPEFAGGVSELYKHIGNEIKYPKEAKERGIEGRVFVKFVIDKDGNVQSPQILKGTYPAIDNEALRVVTNMPKWEPAKQNGKAVNTFFTMPIVFKLN